MTRKLPSAVALVLAVLLTPIALNSAPPASGPAMSEAASALLASLAEGLVIDIGLRAVRAATVSESNHVRVLQTMAMETRIQYALMLAAIVTVAALLRFAFVNHRSGEHRFGTVIVQGTVLLLAFTLCLAVPVLAWR